MIRFLLIFHVACIPQLWIICKKYNPICMRLRLCSNKQSLFRRKRMSVSSCMFHRIQMSTFNSSSPGQNGCHFADDIFRCIFVNDKLCIVIKISLKFVLKGSVDNYPIIGLDNGLVPNRQQAIIWTNADSIHWCIYSALGGDELKYQVNSAVQRGSI